VSAPDEIDDLTHRQRSELRHQRMKAEREAALQRADRIEAEVAELKDHDWAGRYSTGGGLNGLTVLVAPRNGVVFVHWSDIGDHDRNHGDIREIQADRLMLDLAIDPRLGEKELFWSEMLIVRWGPRRYLLSTQGVKRFCNEYNSGHLDPRRFGGHAPFILVRDSDVKLPADGMPELPEEYRRFLLPEPIDGELIEVGPRESHPMPQGMNMDALRVTATANVGAEHGVFIGMEFCIVEPSTYHDSTVIAVEAKQCTVEFRDYPHRDERGVDPKVGWKLSTRDRHMDALWERAEEERARKSERQGEDP
jgi:hypothetical protein